MLSEHQCKRRGLVSETRTPDFFSGSGPSQRESSLFLPPGHWMLSLKGKRPFVEPMVNRLESPMFRVC